MAFSLYSALLHGFCTCCSLVSGRFAPIHRTHSWLSIKIVGCRLLESIAMRVWLKVVNLQWHPKNSMNHPCLQLGFSQAQLRSLTLSWLVVQRAVIQFWPRTLGFLEVRIAPLLIQRIYWLLIQPKQRASASSKETEGSFCSRSARHRSECRVLL